MTQQTDILADIGGTYDAPAYTPLELQAKIERHLRSDLPLYVTSPPGAGKTEILISTAQKAGYAVWRNGIHLSHYSSLDAVGLPFSCVDWDHFVFKSSPLWPDPKDTTTKLVIFIDEMSNCPPEMQHVVLRLLHEKRIHDHVYGDNVRIMAAGNSEGDRTYSGQLSTAVNNRVAHAHLVINNDQWLKHAEERGVDYMIRAFIKQHPSALSTFDPQRKERAFASPRSWFLLSKDIAANNDDAGSFADVASWVGAATAREFHTFSLLRHQLVEIADIVKNPLAAKLPDESRRDLYYATVCKVARGATLDNLPALWQYIGRMQAAYLTLFVLDATRANSKLLQHPLLTKWCLSQGKDLFMGGN